MPSLFIWLLPVVLQLFLSKILKYSIQIVCSFQEVVNILMGSQIPDIIYEDGCHISQRKNKIILTQRLLNFDIIKSRQITQIKKNVKLSSLTFHPLILVGLYKFVNKARKFNFYYFFQKKKENSTFYLKTLNSIFF